MNQAMLTQGVSKEGKVVQALVVFVKLGLGVLSCRSVEVVVCKRVNVKLLTSL
jgi:hypothetical protein